MLGHTYFLTLKLNQEDAAKYCKDHGGKPFIPKTEDEFLYYVSMTVDPENNKGSWYPVNDIEEEGHAVLLDGTAELILFILFHNVFVNDLLANPKILNLIFYLYILIHFNFEGMINLKHNDLT
ncbi:hypothetical protein Avbf_00786, partial [Armadillidium vulgare]